MINYSNKTYNLLIIFFYYILFLLILERYLCFSNGLYWPSHYNNPNYIFLCKDLALDLWGENKLVENLQSLFLFISLIYFYLIIKKINYKNKFIYSFFIISFIGIFYFLGEEISWGQHFFKWSSSEFFLEFNNQKETNIHNISNLFNELPRTIVLLWCCFSFLVLYIGKFFKIKKVISFLIFPNKKLLIISLSLIFFVFPDLILSKFDLDNTYQRLTFNFLRLSELQELIIAFYFFVYSSSINKEFKKKLSRSYI